MMSRMKFTAVVLCLLGLMTFASAATINVPADQPTIMAAYTAAVSGDTIQIAAGTYDEILKLYNKNITLLGPNAGINPNTGVRGAEAIITGGVSANDSNPLLDYITIDGLKFTGSNIFIGSLNNGYTVTNCIIENIVNTNISGMQINSSTPVGVVTNNLIQNTQYAGILIDGFTSGVNSLTVTGNVIMNTPVQGIQLANNIGNAEISGNTIINANILHEADRGAIRIYGSIFSGVVNIHDNIIQDSFNGIAVKDGQNITGKNITVQNNSFTGISGYVIYHGGTGTLSAKPGNNFDGAVTNLEIEAKVYHLYDDVTKGLVDYGQVLTPATVWVDDDWVGSIPGSTVSGHIFGYDAFTTIQAGINAVATAGTVNVAAGTYAEAITIAKALTIEGAGETTVIGPVSGSGITLSSSNVTLNNLKIDGTLASGILVNAGFENITFDSVISTGSVYGAQFALGTQAITQNVSINNCSFSNNTSCGVKVRGNVQNFTLTGGHLDNNTVAGLYVADRVKTETTYVFDGVNISNATFNGNGLKGLYIEVLSNALLKDLQVIGSGISTAASAAGIDINLKFNDYSNITLENLKVSGCGGNATSNNWCLVAKARNDGSTYGSKPASLAGLQVIGGSFESPTATRPAVAVGNNVKSWSFSDAAITGVGRGLSIFTGSATTTTPTVSNISFGSDLTQCITLWGIDGVGGGTDNEGTPTTTDVTATGCDFGGLANSEIEDKVYHKLDDPALGFVNWGDTRRATAITAADTTSIGGSALVSARLTIANVPISGAEVTFACGAETATVVTDLNGTATATLVTGNATSYSVTFAGTPNYTAASDSAAITVLSGEALTWNQATKLLKLGSASVGVDGWYTVNETTGARVFVDVTKGLARITGVITQFDADGTGPIAPMAVVANSVYYNWQLKSGQVFRLYQSSMVGAENHTASYYAASNQTLIDNLWYSGAYKLGIQASNAGSLTAVVLPY